jgi:hypothetical protein
MGVKISEMSVTWDDAGTTFSAISMDVTDTASASGSMLMDLQVGGVSKFTVDKGGDLTAGSGDLTIFNGTFASIRLNGGNQVFNAGGRSMTYDSSGKLSLTGGGNQTIFVNGLIVGDRTLETSSASIWGEAANTLAQRNGANAQEFRLYNTYTDASNYERGGLRWVSNILRLGTDGAGTGTSRNVEIAPGGSRAAIFTASAIEFSREIRMNSNELEFTEMSPPTTPGANTCNIYAKDNGAGKTQLVVLMPDGAETVLATEG